MDPCFIIHDLFWKESQTKQGRQDGLGVMVLVKMINGDGSRGQEPHAQLKVNFKPYLLHESSLKPSSSESNMGILPYERVDRMWRLFPDKLDSVRSENTSYKKKSQSIKIQDPVLRSRPQPKCGGHYACRS